MSAFCPSHQRRPCEAAEELHCADVQRGSSLSVGSRVGVGGAGGGGGVQWHNHSVEHRRKSTYQCQATLTLVFCVAEQCSNVAARRLRVSNFEVLCRLIGYDTNT